MPNVVTMPARPSREGQRRWARRAFLRADLRLEDLNLVSASALRSRASRFESDSSSAISVPVPVPVGVQQPEDAESEEEEEPKGFFCISGFQQHSSLLLFLFFSSFSQLIS